MAVVIKETRILNGTPHDGVRVYKSHRPVGAEAQIRADALDQTLETMMRRVVQEVESEGLLGLKGRRGVVRLWWAVGSRLRQFVDSLEVSPSEDRLFLWRAMYDHAPELVPGKIGARAERPLNSHFYYCYQLGGFDWAAVKAFGDWTSWVEFFDSERIRSDPRIVDWFATRLGDPPSPRWAAFTAGGRADWFRTLTKSIRARFQRRDSRGLSDEELFGELDLSFDEVSPSPAAFPGQTRTAQ